MHGNNGPARAAGKEKRSERGGRLVLAIALLIGIWCAAPAAAAGFMDDNPAGGQGFGRLATLSEGIGGSGTDAAVGSEDLNESDGNAFVSSGSPLEDAVAGVSDSLAGATVEDVVVYSLITDVGVADPGHLGRSTGVKVDLAVAAAADPLADTLWWYEEDATRVVHALYDDDDAGADLGFVAVVFTHPEKKEYLTRFVLDAADAATFPDGFDNGYVRYVDWTEAEIVAGADIGGYEAPDRALGPERSAGDVPCQDGLLEAGMTAVAGALNTRISEISHAARAEEYEAVGTLSMGLVEAARADEAFFRSLSVSEEMKPAYREFLNGLVSYQDAGSLFWYGASFNDLPSFSVGNDRLVQGQTQTRCALERLSIQVAAPDLPPAPPEDLYPDALLLKQRYEFKDRAEANSLSVRVDSFAWIDRYYTGKDSGKEEHRPSYGNRYLGVLVEVNHLGYWGKGNQKFKTPKPDAFTLLSQGDWITPTQPDASYIRNVGSVYQQVTLDRKERIIGYLVYEVPASFDPDGTYLKVDLGDAGAPIWRIGERPI